MGCPGGCGGGLYHGVDVYEAARLLGVVPGCPVSEVRAAYRAKLAAHHPDAGGDGRVPVDLLARARRLLEAVADQAGVWPPAGYRPVDVRC